MIAHLGRNYERHVPHAVVEIVQTSDKVAGAADTVSMLLKAIRRAFREYTGMYQPVLNSSGNFRGMAGGIPFG